MKKANLTPGKLAVIATDKKVDTAKAVPGLKMDELFAIAMALKIRKNRFALYSRALHFFAGVVSTALVAAIGSYIANL